MSGDSSIISKSKVSFIGKVCKNLSDGDFIDWNDIIDAYDAEYKTDHKHIKELINLGI
jgi:hypothetical protein